MNKQKYDVAIVGGGHNGLTTACYLARAGLNVVVVERHDYVGGAAVSREIHPGWTYSNCSYVCSLLRPEIFRDLELAKHGLQIIPYEGSATMLDNGDFYGSYNDHDLNYRSMSKFSAKDAEAYERFSRDVMRQCKIIKPLLKMTPPDPTSFAPKDIMGLFEFAKHFAGKDELGGIGEKEIHETIRFWTMSVRDYLEEYFESEVIKAHMAGSAIIGTALGPFSPGSAYVLLHHYMGEVDGNVGAWGYARGGMGSITQAMSKSLIANGGKIKAGSAVKNILIKNNRSYGLALENGDEIYADKIVSNLDVKRTFLKVVEKKELPSEFYTAVKNFKIRGSSGKLNIALDDKPIWKSIPKDDPASTGDLHFTQSIAEMEGAYDDWKDGKWSSLPYVDMCIPTLNDPTMAPQGKHYMSVFVQYVPYNLADGGWTEEKRIQFGDHVMKRIANYSTNFEDIILHAEVRTPKELESEVGLTEGNIFQGELTMDQLMFNRPIPGYAQYKSPIKNLYMCGSSTHPGGGVMGAPGANAARVILNDLGKKIRSHYL
ncbi:NAD(P)/FAD-dependent oxidoreductase [Alphaproteobacteria bacterium]|nr:NAD(P)/FAD-dependent oxidoreductase [Alphaproteobacteria bacterium]